MIVPLTEDLAGAGETAQQVSVRAALAEDQGLDLSMPTPSVTLASRDPTFSLGLHGCTHSAYTYIRATLKHTK